MTVEELINKLTDVKDKSKKVIYRVDNIDIQVDGLFEWADAIELID